MLSMDAAVSMAAVAAHDSAVAAKLHRFDSSLRAALARPSPHDVAAALLALKRSDVTANLSLARNVPNWNFFSYVNGHMGWIDALEHRMGIERLWRPGRRVLAIGGAHGMVDALLASRHGHEVVLFDLPWLYSRGERGADVLRLHCREISGSQFGINSLDEPRGVAQLPAADRSFDAVTFGGSTIGVLQKAGVHAAALLNEATFFENGAPSANT